MGLKLPYRCLIMDHDDTVVMSTPQIHYPAHVETLKKIRPGAAPVSLEDWFRKNFHPGIANYLQRELGFTPEEMDEEYRIWRNFTLRTVPDFFPGMFETLADFRKAGGILAVVSHSEAELIERDYRSVPLISGFPDFIPDRIFGWTPETEKRKPHPYPVLMILREFGLNPDEVLVVDDLKPGIDMARAAGVPAAAAGWGHDIGEIRGFMREACRYFFPTVTDFRRFILGE
jgi:phosphoglycolate phosphatase/pyrophosphatase PpaX